jgi:hypothetical protein
MLDKKAIQGHAPLAEYPWLNEVDRLFETSIGKDMKFSPFLFDCVMSLAYIDATAGLEKSIEYCNACDKRFNSHIGFINLCSPCYEIGFMKVLEIQLLNFLSR